MTGMLGDQPFHWCKCRHCRERGRAKRKERRWRKAAERTRLRREAFKEPA